MASRSWVLKNVALKIDTQGYEAQVWPGLDRWQQQVKVIQVEMSLTPLYEKSAKFVDLYRLIESRGFRCISLEPNFIDRKTYERSCKQMPSLSAKTTAHKSGWTF